MRGRNRPGHILLRLLLVGVPCFSAHAGFVSISGIGGDFAVSVTSYKEARFQTVLKQQYDFSCGSAALASLLTYHYGDQVSEKQVFEAMFEKGDQQRIRQQGFSLLDMQGFLEARGYKADGFRVSLDTLVHNARVPAIVLTNTNGYRHFVILKGATEDSVLIGDPALGVRAVPRPQFEASWDGLMFLIRSHADIGRSRFNLPEEWAVERKAPYGTALTNQGLANFTLLLPRELEF